MFGTAKKTKGAKFEERKNMDVTSRTELCGVIKFCSVTGMTPTDTLKFISKASSAVKCSKSLAFKWHQWFSAGDDRVEDQSRSERKKSRTLLKFREFVTHKSTVARTVMCRQDGRGRFPALLDDHSKCRTNSQRKSQLS